MSEANEAFWAGEFGGDYMRRNRDPRIRARALAFLARVLARAGRIGSVIEFGANVGYNLDACRSLMPWAPQAAVEIHPDACNALRDGEREVFEMPLSRWTDTRRWDLVICKGLLIHIPPAELPAAYDAIYRASARYLLIGEYFDPKPQEVPYRGHAGVLWKRDFAGELMDRHPDLALVDYGFFWRRDALAPEDDLNWWLLEKR